MIGLTIFLFALILLSIKSGIYLWTYLQLKKYGTRTDGQITILEPSGFFSGRLPVPKIKFKPEGNEELIGKPVRSFLFELNNYLPGNYVTIYYDKKQPDKFVIKSYFQPVLNFTFVIATTFYTIVLLIREL